MRIARILILIAALAEPAYAAGGEQLFARCAACHLPSGAGVPGAFPPLRSDVRALAMTPDGRKYLAQVVLKGLQGPITVEGKAYRGMMPAQAGLGDDDGIAAVLTYVTGTLASGTAPDPKPFTAAEIKAARDASNGITGADVARSQPQRP